MGRAFGQAGSDGGEPGTWRGRGTLSYWDNMGYGCPQKLLAEGPRWHAVCL